MTKQPGILWHKIKTDLPKLDSTLGIAVNKAPPLKESIQASGLPTVDGASSPKDDAIGLLRLAAEVEHALMVQYLYSALSLRGRDKRLITGIAIEEMGHLIAVQNLLLSLTGITDEGIPRLIHLGRDNIRSENTKNPLPITLEEVSRLELIKYVLVERPEEIDDPQLKTRIEKLRKDALDTGFDPRPVSVLYAAIRWIFQPTDQPEGGLGLSIEDGFKPGWHLKKEDFADANIINQYSSTQMEWASYPGFIAFAVQNHKQGLDIIDQITEQGEGILGSDNSHFARFLEMLDRFEAGRVRVRPHLPRTPYVEGQPKPKDPFFNEITNPYTKLWAKLFNILYELLLVDIAWAISQSNQTPKRKLLVDNVLKIMNQVIGPISVYICKLELGEGLGLNAAPPFGIAEEAMPATLAEFRTRFTKLIAEQSQIIAQLRETPEFQADSSAQMRIEFVIQANIIRIENLP